MTLTQAIASLLYMASLELPIPEYWRHVNARRTLMRALRGLRDLVPQPSRNL